MREAVGAGFARQGARLRSVASPITPAPLLQRTLDNYDMGIRIISVTLGEVVVPEPVQDSQRDAIKADKDRQRYQQDAETYRNDVVPRARGEAAKEILDAEAYQAAGASRSHRARPRASTRCSRSTSMRRR